MSNFGEQDSGIRARTLNSIAQYAGDLAVTRGSDLKPGDCVVVSTKNSVYRLYALGGNQFHVSGGWFDRHPAESAVSVNGCTFGGLAIWTDVVAAKGLFLEFGNSVSTTRIQDVRVLRLGRDRDPTLN